MNIAIHLCHPEVQCWNWTEKQTSALREFLPMATISVSGSADAFCCSLPDADVAVVWRFRQQWFTDAPNLRLLATPAAGRDYFQITPPPNVNVAYGTFHGRIMAETVLGALLGMTRGLLPAATELTAMPWPRLELARRMRPLRGARVTILGFGHIGSEISRLLQGFHVTVTGLCRNPDKAQVAPSQRHSLNVLPVSELHAILPQTDHLIVVLPGGTETDHILGAEALHLLPSHATVTNVGRGNALNETALCQCLTEGKLSGAFLDVFQQEPLPECSPLRKCPNLWILPHASAISPDYMDLYAEELSGTIRQTFPC